VPRHRFTAVVVVAAALSLSACATPGVNDLYMPPAPDEPGAPPDGHLEVDLEGDAAQEFLRGNDLSGLDVTAAQRLVEEAGFAATFDPGDGNASAVAPDLSRVVAAYVLTQESYPPSHFIVLMTTTDHLPS
jgi:predicted small lipoprotein YifL